jgi:hypothetical protein
MKPNPMNRFALLCWPLAIGALVAGCANPPAAPRVHAATSAPACEQLAAEIARAEQARSESAQKQQDAWKAVVPFVVAARYASGRSALAEAEQRLGELRAEFGRQGCAEQGD